MLAPMGKRDKSDGDGEALWARITAGAKPLGKDRVTHPPGKAAARRAPPVKPQKAKLPEPETQRRAVQDAGGALDRQTARKLESGRIAVDARLDLHGMKQKDAHAALRKFLKWARAKDYRHVLIITGKGAMAEERKSFYAEEARGVLRQAVPQWLSQADLAPLVVSVSEAPRRLGGEGALYVRLRKWSSK